MLWIGWIFVNKMRGWDGKMVAGKYKQQKGEANMNAIEVILKQLDDAWNFKWESLCDALKGVTEEEAQWQADCYADEPQEEGWPKEGTILGQVAHIAISKKHYVNLIKQRPSEDVKEPERKPAKTLEEERIYLKTVHEEYRAVVEALSQDNLSDTVRGDMPLHQFIAMNIRHDVWHASQIKVARRLYNQEAKVLR